MTTGLVDSHITCKCLPLKLSTKSVYPQSRFKHASCIHEHFVYVLAGKDGNISLKDFWRLNIASMKWECLSFRGDTPQHLEGHTLVSCKKLLLLFGGEFGDSLTESSLWIINPDLGYIRKSVLDAGSDRPCVRRHHSAVVYNGAMYVYGGYIDMKGSSSELWKYHVDDEEWELISPHQQSRDLPGGRHGHSAIVFNKHMYLYGGNTDLSSKQDLWSYSFGVNRWDRIKYKYGPPSLIGHTATLIGSRMFVFGGETNQQPVNQLWYFCLKTLKWTQLMLKDQIPARTFHSGHLVSPAAQQDCSVKASSVPYLQKKIACLNLERPRSSPGVRPGSCDSKSQRSLPVHDGSLYSKNSVFQRGLHNTKTSQDSKIEKPNILSLHCDKSTESLKLEPSPSENTADKSPLCSSQTDINYNAVDTLDRNTVLCGLDNPGISDSTEELIRESRCRSRSRSEIFCDNKNLRSAFERSLSYTTEEENKQKRHDRNSVSSISLGYVHHSLNADESGMESFCSKKTRLDPELVLEDLEFSDCFPHDVKIPYPRHVTMQYCSKSSESLLYDSDKLEMIYLDDMHEQRSRKQLLNSGRNEFVSVKFEKDKNAIHFQGNSSDLSEWNKNVRNQKISAVLDSQRLKSSHENILSHLDNPGEVNTEMETCLADQALKKSSVCQPSEMKRETRSTVGPHSESKKEIRVKKVSSVSEPPYIIVLGGKDGTTVNFTVKPLPVWKMQLSSL
ncbi:hypothetical protein ACF0H5_018042 [Mactra antiquata]